MRINEVLTESQLEELSALDVGRKAGALAGKVAQGVGAVAGGVRGALGAAKSGYDSGKAFVGGQKVGRTNSYNSRPTPSRGTPTNTGNNSDLDSMADQDLKSLRSQIDSILSSRTQTPPSPGIATGTRKTLNGKQYQWLGAQWAEINAAGQPGRIAPRNIQNSLNAAP